MKKDIWVLAEHNGKEIAEVTLEILGEARRLADQSGGEVSALLLGCGISRFADNLGHYGADKIYIGEHPSFQSHTTDGFVLAIFNLVKKHQPSVFLCGATLLGSEIAPRLAARLKTGLVTNCIYLKGNKQGAVEMTAAAYGNKCHVTKTCPATQPQMATIVPGSIGLGKPDTSRKANLVIENLKFDDIPARSQSLEVIKADPKSVDIREAEILVAGGRGTGSAGKFDLIWELAVLLSASVAGSRAAVDAGWLPFERQIGLTGKTVTPNLLISCGISGATHHIAGMKDSKLIIAINTNKDAPIFKIATVGIVADLNDFLPAVIDNLKQMKTHSNENN